MGSKSAGYQLEIKMLAINWEYIAKVWQWRNRNIHWTTKVEMEKAQNAKMLEEIKYRIVSSPD